MIERIKQLLSGPTPEELAARELVEAKKALLMAQTGEEYARSQVEYNRARIVRLHEWLANQERRRELGSP